MKRDKNCECESCLQLPGACCPFYGFSPEPGIIWTSVMVGMIHAVYSIFIIWIHPARDREKDWMPFLFVFYSDMDQILIVKSEPLVANRVPSGSHATQLTELKCPCRV